MRCHSFGGRCAEGMLLVIYQELLEPVPAPSLPLAAWIAWP
jgi:hypothetical protein